MEALDALYLTEPELQKCEQPSCHVTSVSAASACDGVLPTGRVRQSVRALLPFQTLDTCKRFRRHERRGIGTKCWITRSSCWASVCYHPDASTSIQALGCSVLLDLTGMQEIPRAELEQHPVRVAFRVDSRQVLNMYSEVLCPPVELLVARCPEDDVL